VRFPRDSYEAWVRFADGIYQREERHRGGSGVQFQGAEVYRGALLSLGVRCIDRRV
jgi:hypothetical protein